MSRPSNPHDTPLRTDPPAPRWPRFFHANLPMPQLLEQRLALEEDQSRHARKVLRLQPGAHLELFDGKGGLAPAVLEGYQASLAVCRATDLVVYARARPQITIAAALPKASRADDMIDQLNQLGADRLIPLLTSRSVVDPRPTKLDRLARNSIESAKQCGRLFLMEIHEPMTFQAALAQQADLRLIAEPRGEPMAELRQGLAELQHVLVLIGPEGGWTGEECDAAVDLGFVPWRIAPNVLRVETAAPTATAILRYLTL